MGRFISPDTVVQSYANPQSLNRYSYVFNNPLRYTDPSGHDTLAIGTYLAAGCGFAVEAGGMIVIDDDGNWGFLNYASIAGTLIGESASAGVTLLQYTTADTIFDLEGPSIQIGGSVEIGAVIGGVSVGAEYILGLTDDPYQGFNFNLGVSAGLPLEQHTIMIETTVDYMGTSWIMELIFEMLKEQWSDIINDALNEVPPPEDTQDTTENYQDYTNEW
jgi:hypothetical protein